MLKNDSPRGGAKAQSVTRNGRAFVPSRLRVAMLLLLVLLSPTVLVSQEEPGEEYRPPRKFSFGLFGVALREDLTVYQGGARDADGNVVIKEKDQLLKWQGNELKTLDDFCRNLYATKPGDIVEVEIATPGDGEKRLVHTVKVKLGDPRESYKELYTHLDKRKRAYDWRNNEAVTKGGPLREKLWPHIKKHKLERPWDDLTAAHERELDLWDSYENLSSTDLLLGDPLSAHQWIEWVGSDLSTTDSGKLVEWSSALLDRSAPELAALKSPEVPDKFEGDDIKTRFDAFGAAMSGLLTRLDPLSEQRKAEDFAESRKTVASFEFQWRGSAGFKDSAEVTNIMRDLEVDPTSALAVVEDVLRILAELGPKARTELAKSFDIPRGVSLNKIKGEHWVFGHDGYSICIGGPEKNVYDMNIKAPNLIIDVGGDDEYVLPPGSGLEGVSVVIDLQGNDLYRSKGKWGVACGLLGTAIIDDHEGDDTYECGDWGIGAAFGGIGLLIDRKGNDRYLGGSNSIGCAAYGVGGVIDLEGNDLYDSHFYSVGCGQPGGVGFVLDHSGDDRYRCTGKEPSPYGTEGEWFGGGIGCGFGWRTLACGGIGLVVDVKGNDIYDAGEFGLACGYFMGVGAVRDMDGDDIYHSSRYGLAAAAHAAVGVFMDDKGNDVYEGKTAASIGGTWDIVTGYFYDGAGDDVYRCDGLGLGACAQNGFGIFWDAGGNDFYRGGGSTLGHAGKAEYAGGRLAKNFGIFMDTGGGNDNYPRDHKNGSEVLTGEYGLFFDE